MGINRPWWTTSVLSGVSLALLLSGGCLDRDAEERKEAHDQIRDASRMAQTASLSAGRAETPEADTQPLNEVVNAVAASKEKGTEEQKALFRALRSDAQLGIAEIYLGEANAGQRMVSRDAGVIHRLIDIAIDKAAMIEAKSTISYASNLRLLKEREDLVLARRQNLSQQRERLVQRVGDLEQQIASEIARSHEISEEAADLRSMAESAPLDERAELVERAAARGREADAHQVKAARLEAQLDLVRPELVNVETELAKSETELTRIGESRTAIQEKEQTLRAEIATLKTDLQTTLTVIGDRYQSLIQTYMSEVAPNLDQAITAAESARHDAERSASRTPSGHLGAASAHQAVGRVYWKKADSLKELTTLVQRFLSNGGVLGEVEQQRVQFEQWQADIETARETAREAFAAAIEAANSERNLSAASQDLRDEFIADLEASIRLLGGDIVEPMETETTADTTIDRPTGRTDVDPSDSPREMLRELDSLVDAGRFDELVDFVYTTDPEMTAAMSDLRRGLAAVREFDEGLRSQFGAGLAATFEDESFQREFAMIIAEQFAAMTGMPMDEGMEMEMLPTEDIPDFNPDDLTFAYDSSGNTAWVTNEPSLEDLNFVRVDGTWRVDFSTAPEELAGLTEDRQTMVDVIDFAVVVFSRTTQKLNAGNYGRPSLAFKGLIEEAVTGLMNGELELPQGLMGPAPGMGGGG